jgi:outer membrane cobalamin receptor
MSVLLILATCLLPALSAVEGPFALTPITVSGTVSTEDGKPVAGAQIVIHHTGRTDTTSADAKGEFSVTGVTLPAVVDITAPGFAPFHREIPDAPGQVVVLAHLHATAVVESVLVSSERPPAWREPDTGATVLGHSDLDNVPAITLDEQLKAVSGFSLFRRSSASTSNPTTHGVTMRGLSASGSSRGLVLLDGVPLNDGFGGWVTWSRLPPAAVDRVDVERGAEGDAYGSDALGGVIRIVTPSGGRPFVAAGAELGSTGLGTVDLSGGMRRDRVSLFGAASWFRTDGSIPVSPQQRGAVDVPADVNWTNGFGRMDATLKPGQRLTLFGWGGSDDRGNGTVVQRNRMSGGTFAGTYDAAGSRTNFAARLSISPNHFYQTFSSVGASRATETLTSTQYTNTNTARAVLELGRSLPKGQVTVRGFATRATADFTEVKPAGTAVQELRDSSAAVAAQAAWMPQARLTFGAGVRSEWRAAPKAGAAVQSATVGHASGAWHASEMVTVRGSAATSHRWPTLNELVRNFQAGNVTTFANPDLKPERARSYDAAVVFSRLHWLLSVGGFHSVIDDAIVNVTVTSVTRKRQNAGQAGVTGGEADLELKPASRLRTRVSATYINALLHSSDVALDGKRLAQVPRLSFSATGDLMLPRAVIASVAWHVVSPQFDDDKNTPQFLLTDAYQLDLRVAGRVGSFGWHVELVNALNATIEVGRSAPVASPLITIAPSRAVRAGFTWRR